RFARPGSPEFDRARDEAPTTLGAGLAKARTPRRLTIATTALATFSDCPRRYQLAELLALEEPSLPSASAESPSFEQTPDPRALGTLAHAWLERSNPAFWGSPVDSIKVREEILALGAQSDTSLDVDSATSLATKVGRFVEGPYARRAAAAT